MNKKFIIINIILFCILGIIDIHSQEKDTIRRFAVVAGSNNGGPGRIKLKYSVSDARSMLKVLTEMGGVMPRDGVLMIEPDRKSFFSGIRVIQKRIGEAAKSSGRRELIFYYSGHSDEDSILLGSEKVSYKEIRDYINNISSDVRIAILDSCSSGAFTRLKGGKMQSPFLVDSAYNMKGYAFMSSSSHDEASQESERIKGSFFTHYLLAGLRGAADMTQDGRITLNEAYQYAYNETLAGTEKTMSGPQHPNYDIQMSGTGDVVMTDIRKSSSIMIISADIAGKLFIRDSGNNLVCELRKSAGREMQLGLDEGMYTVTYIKEQNLYEASISISSKMEAVLSQNDFRKSVKDSTVARGDTADTGETENKYEIVEWEFSLYPMIHRNRNVINNFTFNLVGSYSAKLNGLSFGVGPGIVREEVKGFQFNAVGNYSGGKVDGAQIAAANIAGGDITGAQIAYLFNISYSKGTVKGAQVSNVFNVSKADFTGAQISNVFNFNSKSITGTQTSCIFNHALGSANGLQLSGVYNYSGDNVKGTQISGVFNYTSQKMTGLQLSGVCNYSGGDAAGTQISGVANIAGNIKGVQVSTFNLAGDFSGIQLGVINIAKTQNGLPIGLINISGNGGVETAVWGSTLMAGNAGLLFRSNYIYTMFSAGWNNFKEKIDNSFAYGFHFGIHIPIGSSIMREILDAAGEPENNCIHAGSFYTDIDIGFIQIDNDEVFSGKNKVDQQALQGRFILGYNYTKHISVFAG
ncbi:MAG: caspase family protein, partial [Spirochaetes bacterium]|nr:caspase family protein [Spirochaetota bacterium]